MIGHDLDGRTALVTGGSRGIGRGIAAALAAARATVIVTSRTAADAEKAAAEIAETAGGAAIHGVALDIASEESVATVVPGLIARYGTIPVLVNNAGITRDGLLLRMKTEDWDLVIETNLNGVYRMTRAVLPSMVRARDGRIVNITSVVAEAGNPGQANYAAAKAGTEGFTRSLAREVASRNITVNCVAPGFIDTDMTRALGDDARKKLQDRIPMRRLGTAGDVAAAVMFLVSSGAAYVTGTTLHVNGGMYM